MKKSKASAPPAHKDSTQRALPLAFLTAAVAFAVYARTLSFGFVFDDIENILNNPVVLKFQPSQSWQLFLQPSRALTTMSYCINHYIFGFEPAAFHSVNVLIHVVNSVLVFGIAFFVAKRWLPTDKVAIFSAAAGMIFALHPLQSEAVVYVYGRSSSICALFYLGSLLMMLVGLSSPGHRRFFWFICAAVAAVLAWKAKEEAITLPLVAAGILALISLWRAACCLALVPFVLVAAKWRLLLQEHAILSENRELVAGGLAPALEPLTYFLTSLKASVCYLLKLYVFPVGQCADVYVKPVSGFWDPSLLIAVIVLGVLAALGYGMRSDRLLLFGLLALLISPLTSYSLMPLADVVAEHRIYIAGLGFSAVAAWALVRLPRYRGAALVGVVVILGSLTWMREAVWADSLALWKDAVDKSPELARPHLNLGMAYQAAGNDEQALTEYRSALNLNPRLAPAYVDIAGIYFNRNDLQSSEAALRMAMALSPAMPSPYVNLAQIAMKKNRPEEAIQILDQAPVGNISYLCHLAKGDAYAQLGRYSEAVVEYQEAVRLRPDLNQVAELVKERLSRLRSLGAIH